MTIDHHNLGAVLGRLPRDDGRVAAGGDVDVDDGAAGDIVEKHSWNQQQESGHFHFNIILYTVTWWNHYVSFS